MIFGRIKALGSNGRCPTPEELLRVPDQELREAGLSAAKIAAVRDLAQKTIDGIVPTLAEAEKMSDRNSSSASFPSAASAPGPSKCF